MIEEKENGSLGRRGKCTASGRSLIRRVTQGEVYRPMEEPLPGGLFHAGADAR
jgi:hypothetical protein